jgi:hypothetical protein
MNKRTSALLLCSLVAAALVVFRCLPFLLYEHLDFDSDQAIVGLMAKHLAELRTFPLFFYGQHYMLGVQAWIAAPVIRLWGPSVAVLRLPLVAINVAVAVWLLRSLSRSIGSPWMALAAVLPFAAAGPVLSANLLETLGASVEPFLYVLILWSLRRLPIAFGAVLAAGFLHREFTIFALAGVAVATYWEDGRSRLADGRWAGRAALGFAAIWLLVDQLKRRINTLGPPGGAETTGPLTLQLDTLLSRLAPDPSLVIPKLRQTIDEVLPDLLGMRPLQPLRYNINAAVIVGSRVAATALLAAGIVCLVRIAARSRLLATRETRTMPSPLVVYLAIVGVQALLAYGLSDAIDPHLAPILRYALLALLLPIALLAAFFEMERRRAARWTVALLLGLAAAFNLRDTWRVMAEYGRHPAPSEHRVLADELVARGIRYGSAIYEDAYITSFFASERVVLNSTGKVRIGAYEAAVRANQASAVRVIRQPCGQGRRVAAWCILDPLDR